MKKTCCAKKKVIVIDRRIKTYDKEYVEMSKRMISSYNIKLNPKYGEIIHGLEGGDFDSLADVEINLPTQTTQPSATRLLAKWSYIYNYIYIYN